MCVALDVVKVVEVVREGGGVCLPLAVTRASCRIGRW
jgi:hypothetical protein